MSEPIRDERWEKVDAFVGTDEDFPNLIRFEIWVEYGDREFTCQTMLGRATTTPALYIFTLDHMVNWLDGEMRRHDRAVREGCMHKELAPIYVESENAPGVLVSNSVRCIECGKEGTEHFNVEDYYYNHDSDVWFRDESEFE